MPPPALLPVELVALIEQNITDELNQQNTAQRVREVLLYIVSSLGIPLDPGTPTNPDYADLMAELAKKADRIATESALKQKEQAFKPFAQNELATIEYAYSNLALRPLLRALIKAVAAGVGGGPSGPTQDYISTETLGGIRAGDTFTTADPTFVQLLVRYQAPGFTSFAIANQGSRTVEVGTPFQAGFKSFSWSTSNKDNIKANTITVRDVTANTILGSNEADDGSASFSTAGFTAVLGQSRVYLISGVNSNNNTFFADLTITGAYYNCYGPADAVPTTSIQVRALAGAVLTNGPKQFVLNTGSTQRIFAIELAPGQSLVSVIDQDSLNKDITAEYTAGSTIQVTDASGTATAPYTSRVKVQAAPYDTNHRHLITLG